MQESSQWLKFLLYGDHGAGKTTLAASAVDVINMRDVLYMNAEKGGLSILEDQRIKNPNLIDSVSVETIKEVEEIKKYLIAHCKFRDENNEEKLWALQKMVFGDNVFEPERLRKYRTVIIDSVSEVEAFMMYQILGLGDNIAIDSEMPSQEWSHFKQNNNRILLFLRAFRNMPINVIALCQRNWIQDESKKFHYQPALAGKLGTQVNGFFDLVGYLAVGQATDQSEAPRKLIVQPVDKVAAKNRLASFKETSFSNPIMSQIVQGLGAGRTVK